MSRAADFERIFLGESIATPAVISRVDALWNAIINEAATLPLSPETKIEKYLAHIIDSSVEVPEPETRLDSILYAICTSGSCSIVPASENETLLLRILEEKFSNLFPFPYNAGSSKTQNGITFTVQSDRSVVANGTATANAEFSLQAWAPISLTAGSYKVSGCPAGGRAAGYCINYAFRINGEYPLDDLEYGSGLTVDLNAGAYGIYGNILIAGGTVANNLLFKPKLVKEV